MGGREWGQRWPSCSTQSHDSSFPKLTSHPQQHHGRLAGYQCATPLFATRQRNGWDDWWGQPSPNVSHVSQDGSGKQSCTRIPFLRAANIHRTHIHPGHSTADTHPGHFYPPNGAPNQEPHNHYLSSTQAHTGMLQTDHIQLQFETGPESRG